MPTTYLRNISHSVFSFIDAFYKVLSCKQFIIEIRLNQILFLAREASQLIPNKVDFIIRNFYSDIDGIKSTLHFNCSFSTIA